jgi:hypothetical protein
VTYFKDVGLWFLPENSTVDTSQNDAMCVDPKLMLAWMASDAGDILQACCQTGDYWKT